MSAAPLEDEMSLSARLWVDRWRKWNVLGNVSSETEEQRDQSDDGDGTHAAALYEPVRLGRVNTEGHALRSSKLTSQQAECV